jgi:flavin-dependent dehydrogenase
VRAAQVAVLGGGPAGALAAILLAREGVEVVQFTGSVERRARPLEVLHPKARILLDRCGLSDVLTSATPSSGVLRLWETDEPELEDFGFVYARSAAAIDRSVLRDALGRVAEAEGVVRISANAGLEPHGCSGGLPKVRHRGPTGDAVKLSADWVLIATGRRRRAVPGGFGRKAADRLVALSVPWDRTGHGDRLAIEAVASGWWYAAPSVAGRSELVFLTDADLLPAASDDRRGWLEHAIGTSRLLPCVGTAPRFHTTAGVDAHVGRVGEPVGFRTAVLGDAAMSLDPLSGAGIHRALEGASVAVEEYLATGAVGAAYRAWVAARWAEEAAQGAASYRAAARRFPGSPFWSRRAGA